MPGCPMRRVLLILLSLGLSILPLARGFADVDYQCVQACVSRGGLYLDCEARCTRITPPGSGPQAPALIQAPQGVQAPQAPKATVTPPPPTVAPPPQPAQTPPAPQPTPAPPANQSPRSAQTP